MCVCMYVSVRHVRLTSLVVPEIVAKPSALDWRKVLLGANLLEIPCDGSESVSVSWLVSWCRLVGQLASGERVSVGGWWLVLRIHGWGTHIHTHGSML